MSEASNPKAFPCGVNNPIQQGMTLRDWFAGQALIATSAQTLSHGMSMIQTGSPMHPDKAAAAAYRIADAMLAKRAEGA